MSAASPTRMYEGQQEQQREMINISNDGVFESDDASGNNAVDNSDANRMRDDAGNIIDDNRRSSSNMEGRSNDDSCVETPANVGSILVAFEYNLNVMTGTDARKAVQGVDESMPDRIAMEMGIWCDEVDGDTLPGTSAQTPLDRRSLTGEEYTSANGIFQLTEGEPDVIRTDVECESPVFGYDCVPVKAFIGVKFDADETTADAASARLKSYISGLMENDLVRTQGNGQASYVDLRDRPFAPRPEFGGAGGSGGIVSSTTDKNLPTGEPAGPKDGTSTGKILISIFSLVGLALAFAIYLKIRKSQRSLRNRGVNRALAASDDCMLAAAPEKADDNDSDDGTLDLDLEQSHTHSSDDSFVRNIVAEAQAETETNNLMEDIQRTSPTASQSSSPTKNGTKPLTTLHEGLDPNEEGEV